MVNAYIGLGREERKMNKYKDWIVRYYASHKDIPEGHPDGETQRELIYCKDCRYRNEDGECTQFDAYTSAAGDPFMPPNWFYCGWGKRREERSCYNCKHGAFGFDGDLGCELWHRGRAHPSTCGSWEGAERTEQETHR